MYHDLHDELRDLPAITHSQMGQFHTTYFLDIDNFDIFRVDAGTALLTEDDFRRYGKLILEADCRELHFNQYLENNLQNIRFW